MDVKNFLELNLNKTQLLVCDKKALLNSYQAYILNLKKLLNTDTDLSPEQNCYV